MKDTRRAELFFIVLLLLNFLGGRLLRLPSVADLVGSWNLTIGEYLIGTQVIFILIPSLLYFAFTRENISETLSLRSFSHKEFFTAVLIGILSQPVAWFYSYLSSLFFKNQAAVLMNSMQDIPFWLLLLVIAVTPSIVEEVAFRGIVLHGYRNKSPLRASIITGLFFGILHLNAQQFLYAFVLGVIFSAVVRITGSIYLSMICHFIVNGSQVMMLKLLSGGIDYSSLENASNEGIVSVGTPASIGVLIVLFLISLGATAIIVKLLKGLSK